MGGLYRQYSWIIDIVGILFCAFFLAKISGTYIGKAIELKRSIAVMTTSSAMQADRQRKDLSEYEIIIKRNIFDSADAGEPGLIAEGAQEEEESALSGEAVKTSLDIKVIGVLVVGDGRDKRSSATISGGGGGVKSKGGGQMNVYAVGDEESFAPNTKLVLVQPDRIEFTNNGRLEFAEVGLDEGPNIFGPPKYEDKLAAKEASAEGEKGPLVKQEGRGKFTVDQREVDDAIANLDKLYTDIRAVPNFSGNKVSGMKIHSVKNGSLFSKLGLKRGDVLQKINGLELDVKQGFAIFNQLKDQKNITLDLLRQGQPTTLEYEIR